MFRSNKSSSFVILIFETCKVLWKGELLIGPDAFWEETSNLFGNFYWLKTIDPLSFDGVLSELAVCERNSFCSWNELHFFLVVLWLFITSSMLFVSCFQSCSLL